MVYFSEQMNSHSDFCITLAFSANLSLSVQDSHCRKSKLSCLQLQIHKHHVDQCTFVYDDLYGNISQSVKSKKCLWPLLSFTVSSNLSPCVKKYAPHLTDFLRLCDHSGLYLNVDSTLKGESSGGRHTAKIQQDRTRTSNNCIQDWGFLLQICSVFDWMWML